MTFSASARRDGEIRILHWNIHSWLDDSGQSNIDAVIKLIADADPDVVSLVEVDEAWGAPAQLYDVAARAGYVPIFIPTFEFGAEAPAGGFGNALLTRLPILAVQQWELVWPTPLYDGSE